jgi:hypothetical protein
MSKRNGDSARFNRDRKKRQLRRAINRELRKEILAKTAEATSNTSTPAQNQ